MVWALSTESNLQHPACWHGSDGDSMTLQEQILASLKFHDLIWTRTFDPDVEYPLIAEQIAEQCWLAKDEIELRDVVRNAFLDFYHPVQVPETDSLAPIANDIWSIRKNYKVTS